ncbi:hypothetical protein [Clostridium perfringens]|uniref:hypothetical protein n=1 Tax=Clostridium perfringens TaxID=1502 RepID=UPI001897475E|nr:hypothetical protein [Clostridium perfringens]HBI6962457.1 hypothetical protein [Clostridium perfringens]
MAAKEVLNEKKLMFFQDFTDNVRKIFNDDIVKYNVLSWIIFNTNYSQEYQGLKVRECYFSYSILEEKLNVTRYKLQKIMKELINEGFIEWVSKSKSKGESSVLKLNFQYGLEYGYQYSSQYGLCTENTIINDNLNTVDNMVNNTDNHTLSKKHISKKQSNNIYSSNDIEEIWSLYPLKKGKASAIKKIPKLLKQYGKEQIVRCIKRYIEEIKKENKSKEFILHGSTFFNGRYIDYLDSNYEEDITTKQKEESKSKKQISNFDY